MIYTHKGKAKYISAFTAMMVVISVSMGTSKSLAFNAIFLKTLTSDTVPAKSKKLSNSLIIKKSTSPLLKKDTAKTNFIVVKDTTVMVSNTTLNDSLSKLYNKGNTPDTGIITQSQKIDSFDVKISKDSLSAPVVYHADDSMVLDVPTDKIILYGKKTSVKYEDNELIAPGITFDQRTSMVTAFFKKDSTGKVISAPAFKQKDMLTVSDSISFNMKTAKGLTKGTYTQQGEMYIYGEKMKKIDANVFYAYRARLTTCNLDTPHFAFISKKIKFINNKFAVTGPVHPEFEGIPIPLIIPFGIYPLSQGRHSGLIAPAFTANDQFGIALDGLGYYKVLSDNFDITARGTFYSYGGWTAQLAPRYYKRYHFRGDFVFDVQRTKFNFKGDPDFSVRNSFNIRWTHSSDSKARPGVTFSANVNAGSSKFNISTPNSPARNFQNILTSTINYSKVWKDFNMSMVANHSQNTNLNTINVTLPDLSFNLNTLYPFRKKESIGALKWYENIGVALNSNVKSLTNFSDDTSVNRNPIGIQAINNLQWGGIHNVPITLSLPAIGAFQVSPGVSYSERWYQQKLVQNWNETSKRVDSSVSKGFYSARQMAFSLGVSSRIFGMFGFGKNSHIKAIRHEIRPQLSASYTPDMNRRFYYDTQIDTTGRKNRYSVFSNNTIASPFGEGQFGGLSFSVDNILQMKVKDKNDTSAEATKKVTLLDGLSLGGSYNFLADSFQLTYLNISARTNLFEKLNITASATLDPYQNDSLGGRVNKLVWKDKILTLGRITGGNISISSQFQGGDSKKASDKKKKLSNSINPYTGIPLTEEQAEAAYISNNPAEFADFSIPWSVNFGYSLRIQSEFNRIRKAFGLALSSDINLSGTLTLSPKWQIGFNGIYNFTAKQLGLMSFSISREMHCWQMSINVTPVGRNRFFSLMISPKSALLRDIKVNRTRNFFDL